MTDRNTKLVLIYNETSDLLNRIGNFKDKIISGELKGLKTSQLIEKLQEKPD